MGGRKALETKMAPVCVKSARSKRVAPAVFASQNSVRRGEQKPVAAGYVWTAPRAPSPPPECKGKDGLAILIMAPASAGYFVRLAARGQIGLETALGSSSEPVQ